MRATVDAILNVAVIVPHLYAIRLGIDGQDLSKLGLSWQTNAKWRKRCFGM
jgi:hypothetical protein